MAKRDDIKDEEEEAPAPDETIRVQHAHTYNGQAYLPGEHTVGADIAEALKASEKRVADRLAKERASIGVVQTIDGPLRISPQPLQEEDAVGSA